MISRPRSPASIPESLTDPICHELMRNPVRTPCRHVFDEASISAWLRQSHTCPRDRRELNREALVPDVEKARAIKCFLRFHPEHKEKTTDRTYRIACRIFRHSEEQFRPIDIKEYYETADALQPSLREGI